jgi:hypothetical protein
MHNTVRMHTRFVCKIYSSCYTKYTSSMHTKYEVFAHDVKNSRSDESKGGARLNWKTRNVARIVEKNNSRPPLKPHFTFSSTGRSSLRVVHISA